MRLSEILTQMQKFKTVEDYFQDGELTLLYQVVNDSMPLSPGLLLKMLEQAHRNGYREAAMQISKRSNTMLENNREIDMLNTMTWEALEPTP